MEDIAPLLHHVKLTGMIHVYFKYRISFYYSGIFEVRILIWWLLSDKERLLGSYLSGFQNLIGFRYLFKNGKVLRTHFGLNLKLSR